MTSSAGPLPDRRSHNRYTEKDTHSGQGAQVNALLELTIAAARAGGAAIRAREGELGAVRSKSTAVDLVTDADIASGVAVVRAIAEAMPDARFVVEEREVFEITGVAEGQLGDPAVWVVDPLDGTTSFVHGYPCYSVSVALLEDGQPVTGAVYDVPADRLTSAASGEGAYANGEAITCGDVTSIADALIITGFPYDRTALLDRQLAVFAEVMRTVHGIRRDGSAAIDLCRVAASQADAFWEFGLQPWDTAAGVLALRESGAIVTDHDGAEWTTETRHVCAGNPALHSELLELIRRVAAR